LFFFALCERPYSKKKSGPAKTVAAKPHNGSTVKVPESVLKRRKTLEAIKAKRSAASVKITQKRKQVRKEIFKRAEKYVKEYREKEKSVIRLKRIAKNSSQFYVPDEAKVVFVVRIKGTYGVAPKVKKILQLLRLRHINAGAFVRVNKATMQMLIQAAPYLTWGAPNLKSVSELLYKRGFGKVDKQRVPLTDNSIIAKALGSKGIICMEDLVHEIFTCGKNFKEANSFLWPFKLNTPNGGWSQKKTGYNEGGDSGDRKDDINKLIRRMN